jgi:hypothetical protein
MLFELKEDIVNQPEKGVFRRVFTDDNGFFSLYVWFQDKYEIIGFQLCYYNNYYAVTWDKEHGFVHEKIDQGTGLGRWRGTPVLVPDGDFDKEMVIGLFNKSSKNMEPEMKNFILSRLKEFGN